MKYKLYYTNEYGQLLYPNGEFFNNEVGEVDCYESFDDLKEAKLKGNNFLEKFPLMSCVIRDDDNLEITLSADVDKLQKAIEGKKRKNANEWRQKQKNNLFFKVALFGMVLVVTILVFLII